MAVLGHALAGLADSWQAISFQHRDPVVRLSHHAGGEEPRHARSHHHRLAAHRVHHMSAVRSDGRRGVGAGAVRNTPTLRTRGRERKPPARFGPPGSPGNGRARGGCLDPGPRRRRKSCRWSRSCGAIECRAPTSGRRCWSRPPPSATPRASACRPRDLPLNHELRHRSSDHQRLIPYRWYV